MYAFIFLSRRTVLAILGCVFLVSSILQSLGYTFIFNTNNSVNVLCPSNSYVDLNFSPVVFSDPYDIISGQAMEENPTNYYTSGYSVPSDSGPCYDGTPPDRSLGENTLIFCVPRSQTSITLHGYAQTYKLIDEGAFYQITANSPLPVSYSFPIPTNGYPEWGMFNDGVNTNQTITLNFSNDYPQKYIGASFDFTRYYQSGYPPGMLYFFSDTNYGYAGLENFAPTNNNNDYTNVVFAGTFQQDATYGDVDGIYNIYFGYSCPLLVTSNSMALATGYELVFVAWDAEVSTEDNITNFVYPYIGPDDYFATVYSPLYFQPGDLHIGSDSTPLLEVADFNGFANGLYPNWLRTNGCNNIYTSFYSSNFVQSGNEGNGYWNVTTNWHPTYLRLCPALSQYQTNWDNIGGGE